MKDRLSIHLENGQSEVREAVTVLRNGGTASQSGLVGITNAAYDAETGSPYIPDTIFNVQSTGDSNIRFSSGPSKEYRSSLELLGVGNTRASGLHFCYDPQFDDSFIDADTGYGTYEPCVNPNGTDKTVADFSLIRPSGEEGMEFSHISLSERGYVSIGLTRVHEQRHFEANAPLTIAYMCDDHQDSGTISIHEQASAPTTHTNFGKVYVKPYSVGGRSQALYFKDDSGFETNLVLSQDLDPQSSTDGLIFGDTYGNTFGGWYTPASRTIGSSEVNKNTFYGYGAGHTLDTISTWSTFIGYHTGSGMETSNRNTVVGVESAYGYSNVYNSVILGPNNLYQTSEDITPDPISKIILIGRDLYTNDIPEDGTLAIGEGSNPLIIGKVTSPDKRFTINDGYFSILDENRTELKIGTRFDSTLQRDTVDVEVIDYNRGGSDHARDGIRFNFTNADGASDTIFQIDPRLGPLSNTPNYEPSTGYFAQLDGDLRIKGSIRFQDGTSLDGISDFEILPTFGATGINKVLDVSSSTNYFVLNYSSLALAGSISSNIKSDNTYVAVQVDGSSSSKVGKLSLQGLSNYISSGNSSIAENCNVLITDSDNQPLVNTSANSRTVMIGCDVAYGVSGQLNSVIIGSNAGSNATVSNPTLSTPFNNIWIGPYAGADSNDTAYSICIGSNAGRNSDGSQDNIFIGNDAGHSTPLTRSIGIGKNALRKDSASDIIPFGGIENIEIFTGQNHSDSMFYDPSNLSLSNRIAINSTIAGRTDIRNISIGDARLSPTAPLEVRRDSIIHAENDNDYIQAWYCDDVLVAHIDCDGSFNTTSSTERIEGFINGTELQASATMGVPTSGKLSVYVNGTATGYEYYVTNRDANLTINNGTYVIATLLGSEYRPIWVSC